MAGRELFEVMGSLRSVREFSDRPVSEEALRAVLEMATRAPNGGNQQSWRFIVIRDAAVRREVGRLYQAAMLQQLKAATPEEAAARPGLSRTLRDAIHLTKTIGQTPPVLVMCCVQKGYGADPGATIFPAVQNLMLAAWSLGLGTVLTTVWEHQEQEMRATLHVPQDFRMAALIPVGYPGRPYGPPKRKPLDEVVYRDRWGK